MTYPLIIESTVNNIVAAPICEAFILTPHNL